MNAKRETRTARNSLKRTVHLLGSHNKIGKLKSRILGIWTIYRYNLKRCTDSFHLHLVLRLAETFAIRNSIRKGKDRPARNSLKGEELAQRGTRCGRLNICLNIEGLVEVLASLEKIKTNKIIVIRRYETSN